MKTYRLILAFAVICSSASSQDISFLNSNQSLVELNPSFAGSNGFIRNQFSYRNQWPNISGSYLRYNNTADMYLSPIKAGVAISGEYETQYYGLTKNAGIGIAYAQHIGLKGGRAKIIPSVQAIYRQLERNYTGLSLNGPFIWNSTQPLPPTEKKNFVDLNAGLLYTLDDRLYLGASVTHINSPNLNMAYDYKITPKYSFYGSYNFVLSERSVLQVMYNLVKQDYFAGSRVAANLILWKHVMAGAGYASGEWLLFNAGYRANTFSFLVGYDMTVSKLAGNSAGSWEIHASYNLRNKQNRKLVTSFESM